MKRIILCKKNIIAGTTISAALLAGCSGTKNNVNAPIKPTNSNQNCEHLIVNFGDQSVIFKECENYDIITDKNLDGRGYQYIIKEKGSTLLSGYTLNYNDYNVNHVSGADEEINEIENQAITKGAHVYTLKK